MSDLSRSHEEQSRAQNIPSAEERIPTTTPRIQQAAQCSPSEAAGKSDRAAVPTAAMATLLDCSGGTPEMPQLLGKKQGDKVFSFTFFADSCSIDVVFFV